jgi:uncharacterized repeat protein (TIGR03803 family)
MTGAVPLAGIISDAAGNLYGTTAFGGGLYHPSYIGLGTVFKRLVSGAVYILHSFTGPDGISPHARLVLDKTGNLYGTTVEGGTYGLGTVFKVASGGGETTLHNFTGGTDGANPNTDLILDEAGVLYGTTPGGGKYGFGTVFKLVP